MFCTNCGSKLPDDVKFCTQCGAPVAKVIPRSDLEQGQQAGRESVGAQPMAGHEAQEAPVAESVHDATIGESPRRGAPGRERCLAAGRRARRRV